MKQELSPEHRVALIQYRFERAYKTLEEADYMRVGNYFNAAINRLYYACFYAKADYLRFMNVTAKIALHLIPEQLQIFCAWQEKAPLNQTGSEWFQYIPLFLYSCNESSIKL